MIKSVLPLIGVFGSLTYFFGFFGVAYASDDEIVINSTRLPIDAKLISKESTDRIIVIGGGVSGCSMALALANKGHAVTLIERDLSEQDRIVGELLQPGGLRALERLGLDDCVKDYIDAVKVEGYVIIDPTIIAADGKAIKQILKYPQNDPTTSSEYFGFISNSAKDKNPPLGRSFHHGKFVQRLREKAMKHPSINVIEGTVTKLLEEKGNSEVIVGVEYKVTVKSTKSDTNTTDVDQLVTPAEQKTSNKSTTHQLYSKLTLVADGIWSSQRRHLSPSTVKNSDNWVGLIVSHDSMQSPIPYPLHGHVILTEPSPCLIYQISSTETRVLVDVKGSLPSIQDGSMEKFMKEKIAPQMPEEFRGAFIEAVTPGNPRSSEYKSMPSKFFGAANSLKKGAYLIGDALNMRNPLTGGGMTVCIRDSEFLAYCFSDIDLTKFGDDKNSTNTIADLHEILAQRYSYFLSKRVDYAGTINVLACALHGVFSTPGGDPIRRQLRQACFDYLNLGGVYAAGPVGLLSGLTPKPLVLTTHFFLVAFYGGKKMLSDEFSLKSFQRIHSLLRVACTIIMPLLKSEQTTILSNWGIQTAARLLFPPIPEMMEEA